MTDKIVVLCTCASKEDGERLARALIASRLAACVSLIPAVQSCYRWKGEIETAVECLAVIKSSRGLFASLSSAIERLHPYDVPEILALPVVEGSQNYLSWMTANLGTEGEA
jgi:periplasmic divalent cation tolerance protein